MSSGQLVRTRPDEMRALEFTTDRHAHVVTVPVPVPAEDEALVAITSAGVCGSDLTALAGVHPFRVPPLISGHEGGGTVAAVGDGLDPAWVGRRVAIEPQRHCGRCEACVRGLPHLCRHRLMLGMAGWPGTLAGYVLAPEACLYPVRDDVDPTLLALAEPLAVAHHAVRRVDTVAGRRVALLGGGAIGALITYFAARLGAAAVDVSDPRERSRALCATFGATSGVDPTVGSLEPGRYDVVFVAAALDRLVDDAVRLLVPRGTAVQVGLFAGPLTVDIAALQQDEKTITGSNVYGREDFVAAVAALEADAPLLAEMADAPISLDDVAGYLDRKVRGARDESVKVLVMPNSDLDEVSR